MSFSPPTLPIYLPPTVNDSENKNEERYIKQKIIKEEETKMTICSHKGKKNTHAGEKYEQK